MSGHHETTGEEEVLRSVACIYRIMSHDWFAGMFHGLGKYHMPLLLIGVYMHANAKPLNKKMVASFIGVEDVKTARKYVSLGMEMGLIEVRRSPTDGRKELLFPTAKLRQFISEETPSLLTEQLLNEDGMRTTSKDHVMASYVNGMLHREWFPSLPLDVETRRILAPLLVGLYVATIKGETVTKSDAGRMLGVTDARTRARYIGATCDAGLVTVRHRPSEDQRTDRLQATIALKQLVEGELSTLIDEMLATERILGHVTDM